MNDERVEQQTIWLRALKRGIVDALDGLSDPGDSHADLSDMADRIIEDAMVIPTSVTGSTHRLPDMDYARLSNVQERTPEEQREIEVGIMWEAEARGLNLCALGHTPDEAVRGLRRYEEHFALHHILKPGSARDRPR